jgi:hypothetical protein
MSSSGLQALGCAGFWDDGTCPRRLAIFDGAFLWWDSWPLVWLSPSAGTAAPPLGGPAVSAGSVPYVGAAQLRGVSGGCEYLVSFVPSAGRIFNGNDGGKAAAPGFYRNLDAGLGSFLPFWKNF